MSKPKKPKLVKKPPPKINSAIEAELVRRMRSCGELLDLLDPGAATFGLVVKVEEHILARRTAAAVTFTTVTRVGDSVAVFVESRTDLEAMRADLEEQLLRLRSKLGQIWQSSEVGTEH